MAPKRATFFTYGNDEKCGETCKFIEEAGVLLKVRDISKEPLSKDELSQIVGYLDISHFLNSLSPAFKKNNLDKGPVDRSQVLDLMASDHTLIRQPIVRTIRLTMVGCDRDKITDMLQLNSNGSDMSIKDGNQPSGRNSRSHRRQTSGSRK